MTEKTLYERLGGYDAIAAVVNDLLPRLMSDSQLGRFWEKFISHSNATLEKFKLPQQEKSDVRSASV